jgi:hypothetical protein
MGRLLLRQCRGRREFRRNNRFVFNLLNNQAWEIFPGLIVFGHAGECVLIQSGRCFSYTWESLVS